MNSRQPKNNPAAAPAFPGWIRRQWPSGAVIDDVKSLLSGAQLHTVCQSAHCPNHAECWSRRTATVMVLGNVCTRHCRYCAVNSGHTAPPDPGEPASVAEAARRLGLRHMVITSVTRDDLPDQGAGHIASVVRAVKKAQPDTTIEVLVQDFNGDEKCIETVLNAGPDVFSHNIETVERLFPALRDRRFSYAGSLACLRVARELEPGPVIKSALMVGCGETAEDVEATLRDLLDAGAEAVSIGQYLRPTPKHHPVAEFVTPERFAEYEALAYRLGFAFAVAGPFVRSSYKSEAVLEAPAIRARRETAGSHPPPARC
jgi:lipoic acid synthetase